MALFDGTSEIEEGYQGQGALRTQIKNNKHEFWCYPTQDRTASREGLFYQENRIQGSPPGTKLGAAPPPSPSTIFKSLSIPLFLLLVFQIFSRLCNLLQSTMDVKPVSDPSPTSLQQTDAANDRPRLEPGPPERLLEKLGFFNHPILYAPITPSVVRTNSLAPAGS